MPSRLLKAVSEGPRPRINRAPLPIVARSVPWVSVMLGSLLPGWLFMASAPYVPPLGFLTLLAWRQLRPGLLPVWAGLPLGFFDDLYSGQPMGSAILLWSIAMIVIEAIELRFPWRGFALEWLLATAMIGVYVVASLGAANATGGLGPGGGAGAAVHPCGADLSLRRADRRGA
ncbi:rod shape-determining protein MreD [Novosphingobium sp. G106]|uniref:rod shape-determining protein MreD n=1 Tax=Novosphingobium sp. G106 TaxID=2849500 RepID=UPI0020C3B92A|nr:rod shape-determining protein MreD [Novosphingobium sp. G106]